MGLSLEQLLAREEIRDLATRWAEAVDRADFDTFEACYTDDGTVDFKEIGFQGSSGKDHRKFLEASKDFFGGMQHNLSNFIFHLVDENAARVSHNVIAATVMLDGTVFYVGAYYHDDLVKGSEGWRIRHRRAERVYTHNYPTPYDPQEAPANRV